MSILQELKIISFDDSIKKNLINNYFNFSDRSSRADYIWWMLFSVIINLVGSQLDLQLSIIISIIMIPPGTGISIRRLHDSNKSGWNLLWSLTIIGIVPLYYWLIFKAGDEEDNVYGSNPLDL
ncbi:MAG: hypothetical protein CMF80_01820 [Candidatus Marinimicrobia bacterium]|nr:hypothetical protein [Candidatus Neomarinimicrobiota bacterium]|tara:strand:+ start:1419 stop:1787 length:369 start_codon:yes stop_codon:yes gene_type:complete